MKHKFFEQNFKMKISVVFIFFITGSCMSQSSFFTFFTQDPDVHFLPEKSAMNIPAFQYVFFETKIPTDPFPTLPYYLYVFNSYTQTVADTGIVVKLPFNSIDCEKLKKSTIKKTSLPHNSTVYSFSITAKENLLFETYQTTFSELYQVKKGDKKQNQFSFYDTDSVRLAKKQWALVSIAISYQEANSYKHTDTSTQNKLLYILNRTIGTQQNFRDDFVAVSWQSWCIENGVLRCYILGIQNNITHKCTYKSKVYSLPLNKIDHFEETTDGLVKVVFKENQTGTIELYQAMKAECLDYNYDDYQDTQLLNTIELNVLWSIGHTGLTLGDLNDWLKTF